jgi:phospholipid/cholesterol/gamma-HCH transport system substrate-binding protein
MREDEAPPPPAPRSAAIEVKAALLLALFVVLVAGTALYLLYARGAFERTQTLVLLADDAEGVRVGMDLTFSGFPIGRVRRIELSPTGTARIVIDVPRDDAKWLRQSSVFTLVRNIVGGATLRAHTGMLTDAPLPEGAERPVLIGDTNAELPRVVGAARELLQNLTALTAPDAALAESLQNVRTLTAKLNGPGGAIGALTGDDTQARRVGAVLARTDALLARLDGIAARADAQLLGAGGVVPESRAAVVQLNAMLGDARATLKGVDAVLAEAQAIAANTRAATNDLDTLRGEVDATVRKVERLVDEVNRKWPFARDAELRLK